MTAELITADEVAERLRVTRAWVLAEARAGRLAHYRLNRKVRLTSGQVETFLADREAGLPAARDDRTSGLDADSGGAVPRGGRPAGYGRPSPPGPPAGPLTGGGDRCRETRFDAATGPGARRAAAGGAAAATAPGRFASRTASAGGSSAAASGRGTTPSGPWPRRGAPSTADRSRRSRRSGSPTSRRAGSGPTPARTSSRRPAATTRARSATTSCPTSATSSCGGSPARWCSATWPTQPASRKGDGTPTWSPKTINGTMVPLREMLRHAVERGYLGADPAASVKSLRVEPREREILAPAELAAVLAAAPAWLRSCAVTGLPRRRTSTTWCSPPRPARRSTRAT